MDDGVALKTELEHFDWIRKDWNPDEHPRTGVAPNPGWFAPKDDADAPRAEAPSGPSAGLPRHAEQSRFQRGISNYACRILKLARNAASDLPHDLKEKNLVGNDEDCVLDTKTGDIYFNDELIGNLLEPRVMKNFDRNGKISMGIWSDTAPMREFSPEIGLNVLIIHDLGQHFMINDRRTSQRPAKKITSASMSGPS